MSALTSQQDESTSRTCRPPEASLSASSGGRSTGGRGGSGATRFEAASKACAPYAAAWNMRSRVSGGGGGRAGVVSYWIALAVSMMSR